HRDTGTPGNYRALIGHAVSCAEGSASSVMPASSAEGSASSVMTQKRRPGSGPGHSPPSWIRGGFREFAGHPTATTRAKARPPDCGHALCRGVGAGGGPGHRGHGHDPADQARVTLHARSIRKLTAYRNGRYGHHDPGYAGGAVSPTGYAYRSPMA